MWRRDHPPHFYSDYPDANKVMVYWAKCINFWSRKGKIEYKLYTSIPNTSELMIYSMEKLNIWILNPKSHWTYVLISTRQPWFMFFCQEQINSNPFHFKNASIGKINYLVTFGKINTQIKQLWQNLLFAQNIHNTWLLFKFFSIISHTHKFVT